MRLKIASAAKRAIRAMSPGMQDTVMQALGELEDDPYPADSIELRGHRSFRRLKIHPYRVLYRLGKNVIAVRRIELRSTRTYRGFNPTVKAARA